MAKNKKKEKVTKPSDKNSNEEFLQEEKLLEELHRKKFSKQEFFQQN